MCACVCVCVCECVCVCKRERERGRESRRIKDLERKSMQVREPKRLSWSQCVGSDRSEDIRVGDIDRWIDR